MSNSSLFRDAHAHTRATIRKGDNYAVTFGACLKYLTALVKQMKAGEFQTQTLTLAGFASLNLEGVESYNLAGWVKNEGQKKAFVGEWVQQFSKAYRDARHYLQSFSQYHLKITLYYSNGKEKTFNLTGE